MHTISASTRNSTPFDLIPKKAWFFWGKESMPRMNLETLSTFKKHNPTWETILCRSSGMQVNPSWSTHEQKIHYDGPDHTQEALKIADKKWVFHPRDIGIKQHLHSVQLADMLRHWLMWKEGGLWVDMDICFLNSLDIIPVKGAVDVMLTFNFSENYYLTGFVGARSGTKFYRTIYQEALRRIDPNEYQAVGPGLLNKMWPSFKQAQKVFPDEHVVSLPMTCFYPYTFKQINEYHLGHTDGWIKDHTVGVHWYGGAESSMIERNRGI